MRNKIVGQLAQDAEALVAATKDIAGEQVQIARKQVDIALESARQIYGQVCEQAVDRTNTVNKFVHKNSYQAIAVGLLTGAVLGYIIARGCKRGCAWRNIEEES